MAEAIRVPMIDSHLVLAAASTIISVACWEERANRVQIDDAIARRCESCSVVSASCGLTQALPLPRVVDARFHAMKIWRHDWPQKGSNFSHDWLSDQSGWEALKRVSSLPTARRRFKSLPPHPFAAFFALFLSCLPQLSLISSNTHSFIVLQSRCAATKSFITSLLLFRD
jgi:hypothetical protein